MRLSKTDSGYWICREYENLSDHLPSALPSEAIKVIEIATIKTEDKTLQIGRKRRLEENTEIEEKLNKSLGPLRDVAAEFKTKKQKLSE